MPHLSNIMDIYNSLGKKQWGGGVGERHHNKDIKELYNQTELNRTTVHKLPWARKANCLINFDILRQIFLSDAAAAGLRLVPLLVIVIFLLPQKKGKINE